MKVVVIDEIVKRREIVTEGLSKQGHAVEGYSNSNDCMTVLSDTPPELLLLDLDTWNKGKAIYNYFNLLKRLENVPLVIYNADEGFTALENRARHTNDHFLFKPTDISVLLETVQGML